MDSNITVGKTRAVCTCLLNGNEPLLHIVNMSSKSALKLRELIWYPYPLSHCIFVNYISIPFPTVASAVRKRGIYSFPALLSFEKTGKLFNI